MKILPVKNDIINSVTYVLYEEDVDYCVLLDCGEWETLKPELEKLDKKVRAVLLTVSIQPLLCCNPRIDFRF